MRILCVAEKPSMARQIASILAPNGFDTKNGKNKYCKNFEFAYMLGGQRVEVCMTSVLGHVMGVDFGQEYANWSSTDMESLFSAQIIEKNMGDVAENLKIQARRAQRLIIWTDCDREGEYIGFEIEKICQQSNPTIDVYRARYSVVSPRDIHRAMNQPDRLDRQQIAAVSTRQELDLRSGACLTRLQSLRLRDTFPQLKHVISYGSCQFPTLGFVVEQYLKLINFVPNPFWAINLTIKHQNIQVRFQWDRNRLFDRQVASVLLFNCSRHGRARITSSTSNPTSKWKPLPLRTVEFQKKAAKSLRLSSDKLMSIAESLYNQGYISYPRTETDQFDSKFDHKTLVEMQRNHLQWGQYASSLLEEDKFGLPRMGINNDKAHPPIHPTKAGENLTGDEGRVYEFIVRSYLAAVSHDAKGEKTIIKAKVGSEGFHASGTVVTERNYLDVYPYDFWNDKPMANFREGEDHVPEELSLESGITTAPQLLTESDLIGTMDKNGIGTDATIHEHIKKIIDRKYVNKMRDSRFIPTILGLSLVQGYDQIGLEYSLTKPRIRAGMEADLTSICQGRLDHRQVLRQAIEMYRSAFSQAKTNMRLLYNVLSNNLNGAEDPFSSAPLPNGAIRATNGNNRRGRSPPPTRRPPSDDDDDDDGYNGGGLGGGAVGGFGGFGGGGAESNNNVGPIGPDCSCGKPATLKKTMKAGPNQGRFFWTCSDCNFFEWKDDTSSSSSSSAAAASKRPRINQSAPVRNVMPVNDENAPICSCGKHTIERTVAKDGPNKGRQFYCCASASSKCTFFMWKDENAANADQDVVRCQCSLIAVLDTAKTGANAGKQFYRCSKQVKRCTFFQWESGPAPSGSSGGNRCFKCGQEGHFSSSCPSAERGGKTRSRGRGRRRGGGM